MVTVLKIYIPTNSFLPQLLIPTSSIVVGFLDDSHSYWDKLEPPYYFDLRSLSGSIW